MNNIAGTTGRDLAHVLNDLAGTTGLDVDGAATYYSELAAGPAITVPGTPTSVAAAASGSTVTVTWTAPSNGGAAITSYTVQRSSDGTTWTTVSDTDGNATNASATLTSQANGTYTYRVAATNSAGTGSYGVSGSVVVSAATAPGAVVGLTDSGTTANVFGTQNRVFTWSAPASDGGSPITGYQIVKTSSQAVGNGSTTQAGTTFTLTYDPNPDNVTLTEFTLYNDYTISVRAVNAVGTGPASTFYFATYSDD